MSSAVSSTCWTEAGFDLVGGCAGPIAVAATLGFLGLASNDAALLARWWPTPTRREPGTPAPPVGGGGARTELHTYLTDQVAQARSGPAGAVISGLLEVTGPDGVASPTARSPSSWARCWWAGARPCPRSSPWRLYSLSCGAHPDQRGRARRAADLTLGRRRLRRDGPPGRRAGSSSVAPCWSTPRSGAGQPITVGQRVVLLLQSANHDEREFAEPERFDIHRVPPRQVGFGHGVHFCIGVHAARWAVGVAIVQGLLERYPTYEHRSLGAAMLSAVGVPDRLDADAARRGVPIGDGDARG